jgi:hypothetical protein
MGMNFRANRNIHEINSTMNIGYDSLGSILNGQWDHKDSSKFGVYVKCLENGSIRVQPQMDSYESHYVIGESNGLYHVTRSNISVCFSYFVEYDQGIVIITAVGSISLSEPNKLRVQYTRFFDKLGPQFDHNNPQLLGSCEKYCYVKNMC